MVKVKQIEPSLDPSPSFDNNIYSYYILSEPESPSPAPPNARDKVQYQRRGAFVQQFLHDAPNDFRRPWGYVTYARELTFNEIDEYNLLHFDPIQRALFDLWKLFDKDTVKLLTFCTKFFNVIEGDPKRERLTMANKLADGKWTLKQVRAAIKRIV